LVFDIHVWRRQFGLIFNDPARWNSWINGMGTPDGTPLGCAWQPQKKRAPMRWRETPDGRVVEVEWSKA
jgi:hypothetical protein